MPKLNSLSHKQQRFIEEYLVDFNATQAVIRAGYSARTARQMGFENLRKPDIRRAIEARIALLSDVAGAGTREMLQRFAEQVNPSKRIERKRGIVYLLRADNALVKIGITIDFRRRLATLNTLMPYSLEVVLLIDCDNCISLEQLLHSRFASKRIRGEWFRLCDDDIEQLRLDYGTVT